MSLLDDVILHKVCGALPVGISARLVHTAEWLRVELTDRENGSRCVVASPPLHLTIESHQDVGPAIDQLLRDVSAACLGMCEHPERFQ